MQELLKDINILSIIVSWAFPIILAGILAFMKRIVKDNKTVKESMVMLLRSQIVGKVEKYMEMGFLPDYARSCLEDLFTQYQNLGGNHGVGQLVEQCYNLPPIKKGGGIEYGNGK